MKICFPNYFSQNLIFFSEFSERQQIIVTSISSLFCAIFNQNGSIDHFIGKTKSSRVYGLHHTRKTEYICWTNVHLRQRHSKSGASAPECFVNKSKKIHDPRLIGVIFEWDKGINFNIVFEIWWKFWYNVWFNSITTCQ